MCSKPSLSGTRKRSNNTRMISDASPWVGGGVLNALPASSATESGSASVARQRARAARVTGLPTRSRSAAGSRPASPREETASPGWGGGASGGPGRGRLGPFRAPRRLAPAREALRKPGHVLQLAELVRAKPRLAARDDVAFARVTDRVGEQLTERQPAAMRLGGLERERPAGDRARHGQGRERPARGNLLEVAIELAP